MLVGVWWRILKVYHPEVTAASYKVQFLLKVYNKTIRSSILSTCRGRGANLANSEFVNWIVGNVNGQVPGAVWKWCAHPCLHVGAGCASHQRARISPGQQFRPWQSPTLHSSSSCYHSTLHTTCKHLMMCLDFRSWVTVNFNFEESAIERRPLTLSIVFALLDEAWWMFILELR